LLSTSIQNSRTRILTFNKARIKKNRFATIPKLKHRRAVFKLEAATRFPSDLLDGSLIPIVVHRDGDGFPLDKHIPKFILHRPEKELRYLCGANNVSVNKKICVCRSIFIESIS
jgi:hypothetical protein